MNRTAGSPTRRRLVVAVVTLAFGVSLPGVFGMAFAFAPPDPFASGGVDLTIEFPSAVGLYPRSAVYVDGLRAGEVTGIEQTVDRVVVSVHVDDVPVSADARALLRLRSLIGERYIELGPEWTGDGEQLADGDVIPMDRAIVPAEISDVLTEASRVVDELDADTLGRVLDEFATAVEGNEDSIAGSLEQFRQLSATVAGQLDALDASLVTLDRVVGDLATRDDAVASILSNGAAVSSALLTQEGALDAAITGIDGLLGQVNQLVGGQRTNLTAAIDGLDRLGQQLTAHRADIGRVIDALPLASYGFARAIFQDNGRWFLQPQATGTLFAPWVPNLNSRGGVGSETGDNRLVPLVDFTGGPLDDAVPNEVDTTPILGNGPLLPELQLGPVQIDSDGDGSVEQP
jgi:phospholipid/cholesterol/gamma-HCH transport system substrate-binding protein